LGLVKRVWLIGGKGRFSGKGRHIERKVDEKRAKRKERKKEGERGGQDWCALLSLKQATGAHANWIVAPITPSGKLTEYGSHETSSSSRALVARRRGPCASDQ
jgi:hypothetical protein